MKRVLGTIWSIVSSRALSPLVLGFFLLVYVVLAFFTDEALTFLIATTRTNPILALLLGLVPLNCGCRLLKEAARYQGRRRALAGAAPEASLYDETVDLPARSALDLLEGRLVAAGYCTRNSGESLAAWRGFSAAPVRILFLAACLSLFTGILVSTVSRAVYRQSIIEGIPFEPPSGNGGLVQRILFRNADGPILAKELFIDIGDAGTRRFGVYPPGLCGGAFVYPRYLGIAVACRFSAPGIQEFEKNDVYPIYPPGKEAALVVPESPYKIMFTLASPQDASDPYMTGQILLAFKVIRGTDSLFEGTIPAGGEFSRDGIRISVPDARRMVVTDLVVDYGVLLIWISGGLFLAALCLWIPVRFLAPRREMLFRNGAGATLACSIAEGRGRRHAGVFHEALDFLAAKHPAAAQKVPEAAT